MASTAAPSALSESTHFQRLEALRRTKEEQTREKQQVIGAMDYDDWALILPPPQLRELTQSISGSGVAVNDVKLPGVTISSNHPSGGFFGPAVTGANFRALLEAHPPYIDPASSLAGGYMANFFSYRKVGWDPDRPVPPRLQAVREKYQLMGGIGAAQHFCQDLALGLRLGWQGVLDKIAHYRTVNPHRGEFYDGLEHVVRGIQAWMRTNAAEAERLAALEADPEVREMLEGVAAMNYRLLTQPPTTFRQACQWILWYDMAARMYNGSGSLGRLDVLLTSYYERDVAAGLLSDEDAIWDLASLLVRDTAYIQLGGPDEQGRDVTNRVSFLVLEAARRLRVPVNVGVCVGPSTDPALLRRGVEVMVENRQGVPKFLGIDRTCEGFARNGMPLEVARTRAYSGCHWSAIPGREYTVNDCTKISFGPSFDLALREMLADAAVSPSMEELWRRFAAHLAAAVQGMKESLDFHLQNMPEIFPELVLDLLCYGPIEKGYDAADGYHQALEFYNLCIDAVALATIADSFAAVEQRVVREKRMTWQELLGHLDANWAGEDGEVARQMMRSIPRYGSGGSRADEYARRMSDLFTQLVKQGPTPDGFNCVPGIFSWAATIGIGKGQGATPNGRRAGEPISHGANPDPGFRTDGAPSAMAVAIASVQPGWGNTAPMQIELDPGAAGQDDVDSLVSLIRTHFDLGGTQVNLNVLDRERILVAHKDPSKYPDLVVRVTGFSAYFASLSPQFRQLVVDRILSAN
ncbi:MAG: pyruvate formate lyase family protein [Candidatus Latescibacterota bacterium]